jgi:hypothetical protein
VSDGEGKAPREAMVLHHLLSRLVGAHEHLQVHLLYLGVGFKALGVPYLSPELALLERLHRLAIFISLHQRASRFQEGQFSVLLAAMPRHEEIHR